METDHPVQFVRVLPLALEKHSATQWLETGLFQTTQNSSVPFHASEQFYMGIWNKDRMSPWLRRTLPSIRQIFCHFCVHWRQQKLLFLSWVNRETMEKRFYIWPHANIGRGHTQSKVIDLWLGCSPGPNFATWCAGGSCGKKCLSPVSAFSGKKDPSSVIHVLVNSRLDYCNALYQRLPLQPSLGPWKEQEIMEPNFRDGWTLQCSPQT